MTESSSDGRPLPQIRPVSPPLEVPVFNVIFLVSRRDGQVHARAANLPNIETTASSEPMALKQAVTTAKQQLQTWHDSGQAIPWQEPTKPADGEQERYVAVHL